MRRRLFLGVASAGLLLPGALRAQHRPVVALLDPGFPQHFAAFSRGMEDIGYLVGQTVSYVYRSAEGKPDVIRGLASELVSLSPQVIVTAGAPAIRALKEATSTIPIVFAAVGDAIAAGAVENMAHPGRNTTGLSFLNFELSAKRLEVLVEALPHVRRVAILRDPNSPIEWVSATARASESLALELRTIEVSDPEAFERAFDAIVAERTDALDILSSPMFNAQKQRLVELSARHGIPTIYEHRDFVETGGLLSYGPNISDMFRRAAVYVDKIIKGANAGDLPVEQPTKFELVINGRTAKTLGLTIPPSLLARADEVIE